MIGKLIAHFWDVNSGSVFIGGANVKEIPFDQLMDVWKESGDGGAAVVSVVRQIRRRIGEKYIKTIIGSGYKLEI